MPQDLGDGGGGGGRPDFCEFEVDIEFQVSYSSICNETATQRRRRVGGKVKWKLLVLWKVSYVKCFAGAHR